MRRGSRRAPLMLLGALLALQAPAAAFAEGARLPEATPRWRGGVLFDDEVRAALRLRTDAARTQAAAVSDWLVRFLFGLPLLLNAWLAGTVLRGRLSLAAQLLLCSVLALSLTGLAQGLVSRGVGRERPYVQECVRPAPPPDCLRGEAAGQVSFYSGHAATAAAGATLAWHLARYAPTGLALLRRLVRAAAVFAAIGTASLRVLADRHYATDVIAGALAGVALTLFTARLLRFISAPAPDVGTPHLS